MGTVIRLCLYMYSFRVLVSKQSERITFQIVWKIDCVTDDEQISITLFSIASSY